MSTLTGRDEIIPVRTASDHWNVLNWLENTPYPDCLNITSFETTDYNTLLIDVELIHPFQNYNFTGFDVRGIVIFDGSLWFPEHGLSASDRFQGDGELLNADGYTSLYNSQTIGSGPSGLQGYIKGDMATLHPPDSTVNGYKRYTVPNEGNRNPFYPNQAVTRTFEIDMPDGEFVFGYAVDANWAPPLNKPVTHPLDDFGPEANCPEPWCILTHGEGILNNGTTTLMIEVFDWQGSTTHSEPILECPDLFPGTVTADMIEAWSGITRYEVTIENSYNAPLGIYRCLVSVEDEENEFSPPWLDLTAYALATIEVYDIDPFDLTPPWLNFNPIDIEVDGDYAFTSSNCTGFHIFDITDPANPTWFDWIDIGTRTGMFELNDGYAFITDDSNGLIVADIDPPESASIVNTIESPGEIYMIYLDGSYAYATAYDEGLQFIDITSPESAFICGSVATSPYAITVAVSNGYAYVDTDNATFDIIDIDPIAEAHVVKTLESLGNPVDIAISGDFAYLANKWEGMQIVDIDTPSQAHIEKIIGPSGQFDGVSVQNSIAYISNSTGGLAFYDVEPVMSSYLVTSFDTPGTAYDVIVEDGYAYISDRSGGFRIFEL